MQKHNVMKSTVITGARLIVTTLAIMFANFSSVEAEDLSVSANHDRAVTAPLIRTRHYGNMNGVKIAIPPKYWASVVLQNKNNSDWCRDTSLSEEFKCPIWSISLILKYPSFEPIYTQQDLNEWHNNFMRPFEKQEPGQHWLEMGYRGDLFKDTNGDLRILYRNHIEKAIKHFGALRCDSKFELEHCATEKQDFPELVNEFFFDKKTKQTLIECKRFALPNGHLLGCFHYFVVPEIKAVAKMWASSDMEVSKWQLFNAAFKKIATTLVAQPH